MRVTEDDGIDPFNLRELLRNVFPGRGAAPSLDPAMRDDQNHIGLVCLQIVHSRLRGGAAFHKRVTAIVFRLLPSGNRWRSDADNPDFYAVNNLDNIRRTRLSN